MGHLRNSLGFFNLFIEYTPSLPRVPRAIGKKGDTPVHSRGYRGVSSESSEGVYNPVYSS